MLEYNEIKPRRYITLGGEPYEVLDSHIFRKQQRKPVNQTKLRNLLTGKVMEHTFGGSDKAEEANMGSFPAVFSFKKYNRDTGEDDFWFFRAGDRSNRFSLSTVLVGDSINYLKENSEVEALTFEDRVIGLKLPMKLTFKVVEAPPNVKGNTAQGGNKQVKIETGAMITTPMFVETGDMIIVNTTNGEYVGRG